ncbi:hypothetical protein PG987_011900 [Apiospora arundinis]
MSHETCPHQPEADPCLELDDALLAVARCRQEQFRLAHRFGNIHTPSPLKELDTDRLTPHDDVDMSDQDEEDYDDGTPDLDYITTMDWGSPPRPASSPLTAHTPRTSFPVFVEGDLGLPEIPKPLRELKLPGPFPERTREQRRRQQDRHDWARINSFWRLAMIDREVELQLAEKQLAARINPYNAMVQNVTVAPVERAPSPPPAFMPYPKSWKALVDQSTADSPQLPLSLIPTERIWRDSGRLDVGDNTAGFHGPLTGTCAAATGIIIANNDDNSDNDDDGRALPAADNFFHGGICESTEHHPDARVWVCDDHDKRGRQEALCDVFDLAPRLRHYACAGCCWKIENDETGQFLNHTGWHVFEVRPLPDAFDPSVKIQQPLAGKSSSSTKTKTNNNTGSDSSSSYFADNENRAGITITHSSRNLARSVTRCACAAKVTDRRLCAPHRLEAMMQMHRWHPSIYELENTSAVASQSRKDSLLRVTTATTRKRTAAATAPNLEGQEETQVPPMVGPSCPLCIKGAPVDHFRFRGPRGREGRTIAWVCKACLGLVTGVVASPAWVAGQQRWVDAGPLTLDYPMYQTSADPDEEMLY